MGGITNGEVQMRKLIVLVLAITMLFATPSFAAVGMWNNGVPQGTATDIEITGSGWTNNGSRWTFPLAASGTANSGAVSMTSNDTAVSTSYAFIRKNIGFNAQAGTLANGTPGQTLTILISQEIATGTFVLTPSTKTGYLSLEFNDPGDLATLLFVNITIGWVPIGLESVTVNQ